MELLIVVLLALVVVLGTGAIVALWQIKVWRSVASKTGLEVLEGGGILGGLALKGTLQGVPIEVKHEVRNTVQHSKTYTVFIAELGDDLPPGIEVLHEGLSSKAGKLLGGRDIQVGIPEIDRRFIIRGSSALAAREFFENLAVQKTMISLHDHCKSVHLKQRTLCLHYVGAGVTEAMLLSRVTLLAEAAREIRDGYTHVDPHVSASREQLAPGKPEPMESYQEEMPSSNTIW